MLLLPNWGHHPLLVLQAREVRRQEEEQEEEEEDDDDDEDEDEIDEDEEVVEPDKTATNSRVVFAASETKSKREVASQNCSDGSASQWKQQKAEQLARKEERKRQARIDKAWIDEQSVREPLPSVPLPLICAHLHSQISHENIDT